MKGKAKKQQKYIHSFDWCKNRFNFENEQQRKESIISILVAILACCSVLSQCVWVNYKTFIQAHEADEMIILKDRKEKKLFRNWNNVWKSNFWVTSWWNIYDKLTQWIRLQMQWFQSFFSQSFLPIFTFIAIELTKDEWWNNKNDGSKSMDKMWNVTEQLQYSAINCNYCETVNELQQLLVNDQKAKVHSSNWACNLDSVDFSWFGFKDDFWSYLTYWNHYFTNS